MDTLKKFYNSLKLEKKIMFLFVPLIAFTMIFINVFSEYILTRILIKKSFDHTTDKLCLISRQF